MSDKSAEEQILEGEQTIGAFTLQGQMAQGKSIIMNGYIYSNADVASITKQINLMHDAMDIQRTRSEIPELEVKLDVSKERLRELDEALDSLSAREHSDVGRLSSTERKNLEQGRANRLRLVQDIEEGQKAIEGAKAKVAKYS